MLILIIDYHLYYESRLLTHCDELNIAKSIKIEKKVFIYKGNFIIQLSVEKSQLYKSHQHGSYSQNCYQIFNLLFFFSIIYIIVSNSSDFIAGLSFFNMLPIGGM